VLIGLSPTIMVDVLHHKEAIFPLKNPALVTMPLSFLVGIVVSVVWPETAAQEKFAEAESRMHLGARV
jgi:cation/acetate symporter